MSYVKNKVDQQILSLLVENARLSTSDIARRVNLSRSALQLLTLRKNLFVPILSFIITSIIATTTSTE